MSGKERTLQRLCLLCVSSRKHKFEGQDPIRLLAYLFHNNVLGIFRLVTRVSTSLELSEVTAYLLAAWSQGWGSQTAKHRTSISSICFIVETLRNTVFEALIPQLFRMSTKSLEELDLGEVEKDLKECALNHFTPALKSYFDPHTCLLIYQAIDCSINEGLRLLSLLR